MREVIPQHARQPQRIAGKRRIREHQSHERTERRDKKGKPEQGAPTRQNTNRDQEHIDVAKLQRQLVEPVEFVKPGHLQKLRICRQKSLINEKADDIDHAQREQHHFTPLLRLIAQQRPEQHDCTDHDCHQQKEAGIKWSYDHGVPSFCRKYDPSADTSPQPACILQSDRPRNAV